MSEEVRMALVGCGGIAQAHLRGYQQIFERKLLPFRFDAVCDTVPESAQGAAESIAKIQGDTPTVYTDLEEMLHKENDLDGADICTPHGLHHVAAIACLDAGLSIICEKPIGITVKATKAIIEASERSGKIAATAEHCRRTPGQRAVHWALNDRKMIGEPRIWYALSAGYQAPNPETNWIWRADRFLGGCGMVMDSGAHWADTIRYFFGDVKDVFAEVRQIEPRPMKKDDETFMDLREDTWVAIINFESGVIGTWSWTIAAPANPFLVVNFYGSTGCIEDKGDVFHPFTSQERGQVHSGDGVTYSIGKLKQMYMESLTKDERNHLFPGGLEDGFALELHDFMRSLHTGSSVELDAAEGLKSKAICEAIYESGKTSQKVTIQEVIEGKVSEFQQDIDEHWGLEG